MLFTSPVFAVFFAIVIAGLWLLKGRQLRVGWMILAGAVFYGYWDVRFLALLLFTSVFDFFLAQLIGKAEGRRRKLLLALDVCINLSILAVFKYFNFGVDVLNIGLAVFGVALPHQDILLPIGISFFMFEAVSYCVDVYRRQLEPYRRWSHFALFMFFFPRMIAGPIIRASDFLPQVARMELRRENVVRGAALFLIGLTKKLVIADRVAPSVDLVFANPSAFHPTSLWQATLGYAIQIYCDFSGYSDMAIGLAKILGIELPENFRLPYLATSLTDFWRRWHISLSSWLRDYLYISLGGSRRGQARMYLNLFITMTLGGLWHGANWTFVVWGVLHGVGLGVDKVLGPFFGRALRAFPSWVRSLGGWSVTQLFVCLCWVVFRSPDIGSAWLFLSRLFVGSDGVRWFFGRILVVVPVVVAGHLLATRLRRPLHERLGIDTFGARVGWCAWVLGIFYVGVTNTNGFIYFQF